MLRRIAIGIGVILALPLLVYAAVLAEAHLEMRRVAPTLPDVAAIQALRSAADRPVRLRYVNSGTQRQSGGRTGTYGGFLLEWTDGRAFAIDVGMTESGMQEFGDTLSSAMGAEAVATHGSVGAQLGARARRIEGVAFTHLHYDHTDGMSELCAVHGGTIPVFQTADQATRDNFGTSPGRNDLVRSGCARLERLEGGPLLAIPGFPGLAAWAVGGHTPGSTAFAASIGDTLWIFSGDVTNSIGNLLDDVPKPWVYSTLLIPEAPRRLAELRPWFAARHREPNTQVLVSHDLDAIRAAGVDLLAVPREGMEP